MTPEELAEIIINDELEDHIIKAAQNGFEIPQLIVGIQLLKVAIKIAIQTYERPEEN